MADPSTSNITIRGCNIRLMHGGVGRALVVLHGAGGASWLPFMHADGKVPR